MVVRQADGIRAMSVEAEEPAADRPAPPDRDEDPKTLWLLALFFAVGLIAFGYAWMTVHRRSLETLSASGDAIWTQRLITHWLDHGFFASYGMLWPTADQKVIYRSAVGTFMISGFLTEKVWIALTGHYGWRLLALHNEMLLLLISALLALLAYRFARRFGADPLHAMVLGVAAQMVWFTFPGNLAGFWLLTAQTYALLPAIVFLLLEERRFGGRSTRLLTVLQAIAIFAMVYLEWVFGTMFIAAYVATVFLLRENRPALKRVGSVLLLPWICALTLFGVQLLGARHLSRQMGAKVVGSSFLYRSGLDGDATFYGDHLDIVFGRDVVRNGPDNGRYQYSWKWLFYCGVAAVLATLAAYVRRRAPHIVVVALVALTGSYLLYAAVFSQAVALHPYLYDVLLATPLILALFVFAPALVESQTSRTGMIVLVALLAATWFSMFQLRIYALCFPAPQPAAVLNAMPQPGRR